MFIFISEVSLGKSHIGQDAEYTIETDIYAISDDNFEKSESLPYVIYAVGDLEGSTIKLIGGEECAVPYGTPLKIIGLRVVSFDYPLKAEYIVDLGGGRAAAISLDNERFSLSAPAPVP